ncbi:MAG: stage III sporulation protein AF [Clostridia bacterium]
MNAFVRQLAVLSMLWSFCELLLPDGKQQKMVRMTVSVLVMAALLTALHGLIRTGTAATAALPTLAAKTQAVSTLSYAHYALTALANQAESFCVRLAQKAGYAATAAVYLRENGALDHVELCLNAPQGTAPPPLLTREEVAEVIAKQLEANPAEVWLIAPTDGAMDE